MKALLTYIFEAKFNKKLTGYLSELSKYYRQNSSLNANDIITIKEFIKSIVNVDNITGCVSDNAYYIKIPYKYADKLVELKNTNKQFIINVKNYDIKNNYNKVFVYYKKNENTKQIKIIETGKGSIGKIPTRDQEIATCIAWDELAQADKDITVTDINNNLKDIKDENTIFNNEWTESIRNQITCIKDFLEKNGLDYKDYHCERYNGDYSKKEWKISKQYAYFVKSYTNLVRENNDNEKILKDALDPTDIILYKNNEKSNIVRKLNELTISKDKTKDVNYEDIKTDYLKYFYETNKYSLIGISLKKTMNNTRYKLMNVNKNIKSTVNNYNIPDSDNKSYVICYGNFSYENDEDEEKNANCCKVTLRTFGSGVVGIDVKEYILNEENKTLNKDGVPSGKEGVALGKCPKYIWKKYINSDKIVEAKKIFNELFKNQTNKNKEDLSKIIDAALKVGNDCLPYMLIH